jgi:hypothetical protein
MKRFIIVVMSLMMLTTTACSNPFKVTDPSDPKFNPDKFRFEDYPGIPQMTEALKKLFPVGTPKEFVERVLVKAGGAEAKDNPEADKSSTRIQYYYESWYQFKGGSAINVSFDSNSTVSQVLLNGNRILKEEK